MTSSVGLQEAAKAVHGTHADDDRPSVQLFHGQWEFLAEIPPESFSDLDFTDEINAAGSLDVSMVLGEWASDDVLDIIASDSGRTILIVVEFPHLNYRWHGVVTTITKSQEKDAGGTLTLSAIHSWQHLEGVPTRPEPRRHLAAQNMGKKTAGPVVSVLSAAIAYNLAASTPAFTPTNYATGDVYTESGYQVLRRDGTSYPIAVKPGPRNFAQDKSYRVEVTTWMESLADTIRNLAEAPDAGLIVTMNLWMPGDTQPWDGANFTRAQLWVDIQDRSVLSARPQVNIRFDSNHDKNAPGYISAMVLNRRFWQEGLSLLAGGVEAPGHLPTSEVASIPYYPPVDSEGSGVLRHTVTINQRRGGKYVYGGETEYWFKNYMDKVSEDLDRQLTAFQELFQGADQGSLSQNIVSNYIEGLRENHETKMAQWAETYCLWREWDDPAVKTDDTFGLRGTIISGVPPGSYNALVEVVRAAIENSRRETHEIEVMNRAPWVVFGDFGLGDLVGIQSGTRVHIQRLTSVSYSLTRGEHGAFTLILGHPSDGAGPMEKMLHEMDKFKDNPLVHP